ncbi:PepSY domain-containing protein [Shewanella sp. Scap07]|uniref:PepSY-associated TM helix domain-containing protein n=1 Tax=Shewanella sp. Scap07 TaxID=2589987 RepID=UPI0015BED271|nr:PepSY-associated TM helix domain-containing protein [Shewanella sp. Scap07]QLE84835.1 PepSY domain-containing protein [Shewanella sp. Scap07]
MKENFFRSMTWLHTWVGLLVCWILLLVFFAGTMSYYRHEISLWTKPEIHQAVMQPYQHQQLQAQINQGQSYLANHASDAKDWHIEFAYERQPYLSFGWQEQPEEGQRRGKFHEHIITADGTDVVTEVRESRGGHFFYRLHFDLHYMPAKVARWIVGFCTLFMLLAIISGIVIHKRIFKDFFSFRPGKGSRSWLDGHNVSSVLALPYHLMITYTGLITLMMMYMPWGVVTAFDGDSRAYRAELNPQRVSVKPAGTGAPLITLSQLLPQVHSVWGDTPIKRIAVRYPGDANSRVSFYRNTGQAVTDLRTPLVFDGVSGEMLSAAKLPSSGARQTHDTLMALHTARFAEPILRLLFFICGLMGCAMIATGSLLWAIKIRQKQQKQLQLADKPSFGLRLVEGLNLTFIAGLPLATSAFFYANRLLPEAMPARAQWEINCFFITLALVGLIACINRSRRCWQLLFSVAAIALLAIPLLNVLTSGQGIIDNFVSAQWILLGFDSLCVLMGSLLGLIGYKLRVPKVNQARRTRRTSMPPRGQIAHVAKLEE